MKDSSTDVTDLARIWRAAEYSAKGLQAALREPAFTQEVILFVLLAPLGAWFGHGPIEKVLLVGSLVLVLVVELLNSAVEAAIDRISTKRHVLSGRAKDFGSAAVLLTIMLAVFTWAVILLPRVL